MAATDALPVHPTNADQRRAWDGDEGAYWAANADHFEKALEGYHDRFFANAAIGAADRVLDVGCGTGGTTRAAARAAAAGGALGVDLSAAMLAVARQRAAADGLANVHFEQADAQIHPFPPGTFDVAIGQTSAMFFGDRTAALANIGRALRPGGRLVLLTWQPPAANEWFLAISTALAAGRDLPSPPPGAPGPFSLADPDVIRSVLTAAGYRDLAVDAVDGPMWFGSDGEDAHRLVSGLMGWMVEGLDPTTRARALDGLRAAMAAHETTEGVVFGSALWLSTAIRP